MTERSFSSSGGAPNGPDKNGAGAEKAVLGEEFIRIGDSYKLITENIEMAKLKAGRTDSVRLMAVTKTVPYEKVNYAVSLGIDLLGENRVQEFLGKYEFYDKKAEIHFIGGLQNNKVKYIIDKVSLIHSVDSIKLAEEIDKRAVRLNKVTDILIEVNIGNEDSKGGVSVEGLDGLVSRCLELSGVKLKGFMAIPPPDLNGSSERYFEAMERLYNDYRSRYGNGIDTLSMGMSQDYEQAVLHGSNIVRVGSALFGNRK